jgi:hypothetical protein
VFNSPFREGTAVQEGFDPATGRGRPVIKTEEGFEKLHTLLYFLYTGHVLFTERSKTTHAREVPGESVDSIPNYLTCTPEEIYAIAHRLNIPRLKDHGLHFFRKSWRSSTLALVAFSDFAQLYPEVWEIYRGIFRSNWNWLKTNKHFRSFMDETVERKDEESMKVFERFWTLLKYIEDPVPQEDEMQA